MDSITGMRTFITVVRAGSFTAAAQRLNMSTALVSKYVGKLETRLGARLLNRTTRSLTLTEIGTVYYERGQQLIDDFDELEAAVQNRSADAKGKLVISAPITFGDMYLTTAIADFLDQHPALTVDLRLTDRFVSLIDEGIDVAIRIAELEDSALIARRIASTRIVACAAPSYLARHGVPDHPSDLARYHCIIDSNFRNGHLWPFTLEGQRKSIRVDGRFIVNSASAVRQILLRGAGIALTPTYAIGEDIARGDLVVVLEEFEALALGIYAIYLHQRHLAAKVRVFVDAMIERFSPTPKWERFAHRGDKNNV